MSELNTLRATPRLQLLQTHAGWCLLLLFFILLPFGVSYNIPLGMLAATGLCFMVVKYRSLVMDQQIRLYTYLFLCIYVPMLLSLPDAINFPETFRKVSSFLVYFFTGLAVIGLIKNETTRKYFLFSLGLLLTLWILDALYQYFSGHNLFGYPYAQRGADENNRLTGVFYPKFRLGIVLAILSPVYFEFIRQSMKKTGVVWIMIIPLFFIILLGGSRTSWAILLLSCVLYTGYFLFSGYHRTVRMKPVVIGLLLLASIFVVLYNIKPAGFDDAKTFLRARIHSIEYNPGDSPRFNSIELRVQIWETGLRVASSHWINGIGVRGYRYIDKQEYIQNKKPVVSDIARISTHPHQVTLEVLVETGIIGILGYILFWFILLKSMFTNARYNKQLDYMPWCIAVIIAMFPLNMHKSFYEHFSSSIIWALVALAIAFYPANKKLVLDNTHK